MERTRRGSSVKTNICLFCSETALAGALLVFTSTYTGVCIFLHFKIARDSEGLLSVIDEVPWRVKTIIFFWGGGDSVCDLSKVACKVGTKKIYVADADEN